MNKLHFTPLGANMNEIRIENKFVLISYQTPVAFSDSEGKVFITNKKYSKTTSKHISQWVAGRNFEKVDQSVIDNLMR